jgi:transposase
MDVSEGGTGAADMWNSKGSGGGLLKGAPQLSAEGVTKLSFSERIDRPSLNVGSDARALLERWTRASTTPQRVVRRSQIVLLSATGMLAEDVAARLGISKPTVRLWLSRFERGGPNSLLHDAPGRGRHASVDASTIRARLEEAHLLATNGEPVSLRRAAAFLKVSPSALWRALRRPSRGKAVRELPASDCELAS